MRLTIAATAVVLVTWAAVLIGQAPKPDSERVLEIRSYNLKPGTRDEFHRLFVEHSLPMLRRWNVDVVAFGPSAHDADSYFLMRSFPSVAERQRSEDAFYGSEEWRNGPRERVLAAIVSFTTIVIAADAATLNALRATMPRRTRK